MRLRKPASRRRGEDGVQFGARVADAGQVRHDLEAKPVAQDEAVFEGALAGRAARAIGDGDEIGLIRGQRGGGVEDLARALGGFRREKLDRDEGAAGAKFGGDGLAGHEGRKKTRPALPRVWRE